MKVINAPVINPYGGLNFLIKELDKLKVGTLLDRHLPKLAQQSKYSWRDILYTYWSVFFCGGDCAEDISDNFRNGLSNIPALKIPSPDRVLDRIGSLTVPTATYRGKRGKSNHDFNHNLPLNRLNLHVLRQLDLEDLRTGVLDYDNTTLCGEKKDTRITYQSQEGYCPGVGIMGNTIVYVEGRNGNSDAQTLQHQTLQRMFSLLEKEQVPVKAFRGDAASYQLDTLNIIDRYADRLYIRARMTQPLARAIHSIDDWEAVDLGNETGWRGEITHKPFIRRAGLDKKQDRLKTYRLVVTKVARRDGQVNLFTGEACAYSCIITSDWQSSQDEVVAFYNQRGKGEKEFDVLKNDFGWNHMPFSWLDQNTAYLIIMAICRNLYTHLIRFFSRHIQGLRPHHRIKKFIFRFITVPAKWIRRSRTNYLKVYGNIRMQE